MRAAPAWAQLAKLLQRKPAFGRPLTLPTAAPRVPSLSRCAVEGDLGRRHGGRPLFHAIGRRVRRNTLARFSGRGEGPAAKPWEG